jgi:putative cell wall-binding protein
MKSKKKEITRLKAKKVIFLDSERATSKAVEDKLRKSGGFPIHKLAGKASMVL